MNKKLLIAISVLALIGLAVYLIYHNRKKNGTGPTVTNTGPETVATDIPPFPLKYGSKGPEVGQLQKYLIREYGARISNVGASPTGAVDNIWGDLTDAAVKKFLQRDNVSSAIYTKFKMAQY